MTIEIQRKKSAYIFRQNPNNPRIIDRRLNRHRAPWEWYATRATVEDTIAYLLELEREQKETQAK